MSNNAIKKNFMDQLSQFVKKKFKVIIISLVVIFICFLSFLFYKDLQEKKNINIANQYSRASILLKQNKIKESSFLLEAIINKDHHFYSPLALYLLIDSKKIKKEDSKIIFYFDKILKNGSISDENIDLIKIKKAIYLINLDNEELIIKTLNPIINSSSVWRNIAINLISDYFLSKDQKIKSKEYMKLLTNKTNN